MAAGRHVVLEELRVLHLDSKATRRDCLFQAVRRKLFSRSTPTETHFLQQSHTYSNKAIPPNSAIPWVKYIQTTIPQTPTLGQSKKNVVHESRTS